MSLYLDSLLRILPERSRQRGLFRQSIIACLNSFDEKAGQCQVYSFISSFFFFVSSFSKLFPLSQAASAATLPSAVLVDHRLLIRSGGKREAWVEHHVGNHDPKHGVMLSNSLQELDVLTTEPDRDLMGKGNSLG
jgi:hypothetical protein